MKTYLEIIALSLVIVKTLYEMYVQIKKTLAVYYYTKKTAFPAMVGNLKLD